MATIGKFTAAAFHSAPELSQSLAQINFDFSIIKAGLAAVCEKKKSFAKPVQVDAPAEYQGLGAALSTNRRIVAEYGTAHITARKLGALFKAVLPETPRLIEAYGKRTSEIAEFDVGRLHSPSNKGIFGDYTGLDGTSIWAAATSGRSVISMHLLACMLYVVHSHYRRRAC